MDEFSDPKAIGRVKVAMFGGNPYRNLQELQDELLRVIHQRDGTVPLAGVLGVLRIVEHQLMQESGHG